MVDCIGRIHDDVLKIWNFNDPRRVSLYWHIEGAMKTLTFVSLKILYGEGFLDGMIRLVEPLSDEVIQNQTDRWVALQKEKNRA